METCAAATIHVDALETCVAATIHVGALKARLSSFFLRANGVLPWLRYWPQGCNNRKSRRILHIIPLKTRCNMLSNASCNEQVFSPKP